MNAPAALAARLSTAAAIAVSGYIHANLYLNSGYQHIPHRRHGVPGDAAKAGHN
jgi:hypothetical protein